MSEIKKVAGLVYGIGGGIAAGPSSIAYAVRREIKGIDNPFYGVSQNEGAKNAGRIIVGSVGIAMPIVSELALRDNYQLLPPVAAGALIVTNGASFVFEVGRSIVTHIRR
jgi:hypothetical protein